VQNHDETADAAFLRELCSQGQEAMKKMLSDVILAPRGGSKDARIDLFPFGINDVEFELDFGATNKLSITIKGPDKKGVSISAEN
jgi:hypothetical protein